MRALTDDELRRLLQRARYHAHDAGFGDLADEFVQDLALRWCEGKAQHQKIEHAFIDYLRSTYGCTGENKGTDQSRRVAHAKRYTVPVEELLDLKAPDDGITQMESRQLIAAYAACLTDREKEFLDRWLDGMTLKEVGEHLGFTESRASQILTVIEMKLRRQRALEESRMNAPYQLETRTCACGCGVEFRVLPTSEQRYISADHRQEHTGEKPSFTPKRRGRPPANPDRPRSIYQAWAPSAEEKSIEEIEAAPPEEAQEPIEETECRVKQTSNKLNAAEIAAKVGMSRFAVLKLFNDGKIPGERINARRIHFDLDEVKSALAGRYEESKRKLGVPSPEPVVKKSQQNPVINRPQAEQELPYTRPLDPQRQAAVREEPVRIPSGTPKQDTEREASLRAWDKVIADQEAPSLAAARKAIKRRTIREIVRQAELMKAAGQVDAERELLWWALREAGLAKEAPCA